MFPIDIPLHSVIWIACLILEYDMIIWNGAFAGNQQATWKMTVSLNIVMLGLKPYSRFQKFEGQQFIS